MEKDQLKQLNAKIQLDSEFKPKAAKILDKMVKDFEKLYSKKGAVFDFGEYVSNWENALEKHYKDVCEKFAGIASEELKQELSEEKQELFEAALLVMMERRKEESAKSIVDTTSEQTEDSLEKASLYLQQENIQQNNKILAAVAAEILANKIDGRAKTIAMTETQFIAETVKNIEADCITNNRNEYLQAAINRNPFYISSEYMTGVAAEYSKEWISALLPTTRPAHAAAHGQIVSKNGLFYVGGEYLRYPSDTSMGASAGNTINCYCTVRYAK